MSTNKRRLTKSLFLFVVKTTANPQPLYTRGETSLLINEEDSKPDTAPLRSHGASPIPQNLMQSVHYFDHCTLETRMDTS